MASEKYHYSLQDPQGVTHTRNSNRVYTHAVIGRVSHAHAIKVWTEPSKQRLDVDRSNWGYYNRLLGTNGFPHKPVTANLHESDERFAARKKYHEDDARKHIGDCTTFEEYLRSVLKHQLDRIEDSRASGYYDRFGVIGYCGRLDLAQKLLAGSQSGYYEDLAIVELTVTEKAKGKARAKQQLEG